MSTKRISGLIVLIVGIVLIIFSIHSMNRISSAKSGIHSLTEPFSGSAGGQTVGDVLEGKASQYDVPVMVILISGIVLTVIGGSLVIFGKKRR